MFSRGGARCLAKIATLSGFLFTNITNILNITVYRLHNINQRFFKGTSNGYTNLNGFMGIFQVSLYNVWPPFGCW